MTRPPSVVRGALLAAGLFLFGPPAQALDPSWAVTQYRRQNWNTRDGLPQSSVESIAQTPDGYLWLGTQEGLARFDGLRFTIFDKANTKALRHNRVTALLCDRRGTLWVGTEGGGVARLRDGVWTALAEGLPNPRVRAFAEDTAGTLFVATDGGLARVREGQVVTERLDSRLEGVPVLALFAGRTGVFVSTRDGFHVVREGVVESPGGVPPGPVSSVWEDPDGTLWLGTSHGLFVRTRGERDATPARMSPTPKAVTSLRRDRDGNLWIGTESGLLRDNAHGTAALVAPAGLSNDQVLELFEDREGGLWVGTQDGGANRLANGRMKTYAKAEGLAGDIVWPVFGDREGTIWIGTKTGGLSRFRDGALQTVAVGPGLVDKAVQSLAQTKDGALWVGTRGHGLHRLKDGRWSAYTRRQGLPSDSISALASSRDGSLWIGTRRGGLSRLDGGSLTSWTARDGLPDDTVHFILEARDGTVWVATNGGGLVRFRAGRFRAFTTKDGLSSDIVNVLHEDADGTLWVGTFGGGLNRMTGERFTSYTTAEGLYDDAIFSILEDAKGRLWMSCNKGIFRVDKQQLRDLDAQVVARLNPVTFGVEDGMKNRECNGANQPPAWADGEGRFWFPTIEGVVMVDPARLRENPVAPTVTVDQFLVDGRPLGRGGDVVLPSGRRNLEFHYAAPSFVSPGRVRYRYKLEGLDAEWVEAGSRRVAYYSRLPPGDFTFRVSAHNEDGVPSHRDAMVSFRLKPRAFETTWFLGLCAVSLAGAIWIGDRLRVRGVKAREEALERLVEERTRELAEANLRLEKLSSLDGLTGVANRRRFDEVLDLEWRRAARAGAPLSLIMLDLDFFKAFNDTNGHLAGDERLRQVAQALSSAVGRAGDLVARYGGEEFVVLLPGMPSAEATALAEKMRASVEGLGLSHNASPVSTVVTLTAGVATTEPSEQGSPAQLLAAADGALYRAKHEGRNRVVVAAG